MHERSGSDERMLPSCLRVPIHRADDQTPQGRCLVGKGSYEGRYLVASGHRESPCRHEVPLHVYDEQGHGMVGIVADCTMGVVRRRRERWQARTTGGNGFGEAHNMHACALSIF